MQMLSTWFLYQLCEQLANVLLLVLLTSKHPLSVALIQRIFQIEQNEADNWK